MAGQILNKTISVDGVEIFYRVAGEQKNKAILLLHGFPTSSMMFRNLMIALADKYFCIAPDFPGFGFSGFPDRNNFEYSFKNIATIIIKAIEEIGLGSFTIYLHDYGCAVGLQICIRHPEKIEGLIVQNGNTYIEGIGAAWDETRDYWENPTAEKKKRLSAFLSPEGIKSQYTGGLPDELLDRISPESWLLDWERMSRPGNREMQWELNCDYRNHIEKFPVYQQYFRMHQPRTIVIWGKHDIFFDIKEPPCYKRDLPNAKVHIVDGGHMALETNFDEVLELIERFMSNNY